MRWLSRLCFVTVFVNCAAAVSAAEKPKAAPFAVKVVGKGKPMILIPGLACSGAVWDGTVAHFKDRYECHVLTLAGFAGQPPVEGPFLETMRKAIAEYIRAKKLDKPVVVGHSLGGFLTYRLGATEPDLVGPLVAVDGMPCFGALFSDREPDIAALKEQGEKRRLEMEKGSRADFLKNQRQMLGFWLSGRKELEAAVQWGVDSDQATVARAMGELFAQDARADLANIKTPVLQLAAHNKAMNAFGLTRDVLHKRLEGQLAKAARSEIAIADDSRHFIMYDAPAWMYETMEKFLNAK